MFSKLPGGKMKHLMTISLVVIFVFLLLAPTANPTIALQGKTGGDSREDAPPPRLESAGMSATPADDENFVADSGEELDQYLFRSDGDGLIKFNIPITRYYFNSEDTKINIGNDGFMDGNTVTHVIDRHILPATATLKLRVYDVDEDDSYCSEVDYIKVNDKNVTQGNSPARLSGANNTWSVRTYQIPIQYLKFPKAKGTGGSAPQPAYNEISIDVDATNCGAAEGYSEWWAVEVDYGIIYIPSPIRPIIFVHGWTGTTLTFSKFEKWMKDDGIPSAGEVYLDRGLFPIAESAGWLKDGYNGGPDGILDRITEYGVNKLNIFAHSKGGLITRMALRNSEVAKHTDNVITFASPHHGTAMAELTSFIAVKCLWEYPLDPVAAYRCTDIVHEFRIGEMMNGFNYTGCTSPILPWLTPWNCRSLSNEGNQPGVKYYSFAANGDEAVVPLSSTTYPWMATVPFPIVINVDRRFDFETGLLEIGDHGAITGDPTSYKCAISYLNPDVYDRSVCPSTALTAAESASLDVGAYQLILDEGGTLPAGGSHTVASRIDSGTAAIFEATGTSALSYTLTAPNGQIITPAVAATDPNIVYTETASGAMVIYRYEISSPLVGIWQNVVQVASAATYAVDNWVNSAVQLVGNTDKMYYQPGDVVTVRAALWDGSSSYTGVTLSGLVTYPNDTTAPVTFYDDGTHGDTTAADGAYAGQFTASAVDGFAIIDLTAARGNIVRSSSLSVGVTAQTAQFQYVYNEYVLDNNYNSLYDSLQVDLALNVIKSGYFTVYGTLVDAYGQPVASGYYSTYDAGSGPLATGWQPVTLSFDGQQIYDHGVNGPYTLTNITVMDVTGDAMQVDAQDSVYVTSSYKYYQFEHAVLSLLPYRSEYVSDSNGNGLYDNFWIYLDFDVVLPDNYDVTGRLVDKNGNEIAWGSANFDVASSGEYGAWVYFDGHDIGRHKVDGPYHLEDVSISSTTGSTGAFFGKVYTTQTYSFKKFEGVIPYFADVSLSHPYWDDIEVLYANGLTGGCGTAPLKFCPDQIMNRAQAAVFMVRGAYGAGFVPHPTSFKFKDNWSGAPYARNWAEAMRETNLTSGCKASPLLYCPMQSLNREQAVVFGLKMKYGTNYMPPPATGKVFADMTNPKYWATAWAEKAYADGLITSCGMLNGKPKFCPTILVTRGLGAYIIVRAKSLVRP
jgi:hypothetical protein